MPVLSTGTTAPDEAHAFREMFAARKRVFVDLLGWDVPVLEDRWEIDQFDDPSADYLILLDDDGHHLASARLLETTRPHILRDLFAGLCEGPVPEGHHIREITRFCLDPRSSTAGRRVARNRLVSALVEYALYHGIGSYTAVADAGWFQQILSFGWRCEPLGLPSVPGPAGLVALHISIEADTPRRLGEAGIWMPTPAAETGKVAA